MQYQIKNREIRVFLSSTFRDMQFERDYLIKNIFPQIRQACRERLVEFTEIDLRWGVTKEEAEQGKVVRICLEEIDRCRPYFLGFMGERYGWAPSDGDLHNKQELIQNFPVVETSLRAGKSVTEMEVLHGVLNNPAMAGHAFFYFRNHGFTETLSQRTENPAEYFENDEQGKNKLADLKARIKQSGFPVHENYLSIEDLGEQIKSDLLTVLDTRFPVDQTPSPLQAERNIHETYAENRCKAYIANPADITALDGHLQTRNSDKSNLPIIIGGGSGLGKSALLAYWVKRVETSNPKQFVIQHYAGVSGDATPTAVLRRIMLEIKLRNHERDEVPVKPADIVQDFPVWLAKIKNDDPLLISLDALNQIECENLNWLPSFIPPNIALVVSCLPGALFEQLIQRGWQMHAVQPMDASRREQLIDSYLAGYCKALSMPQKQTLVSAPQCANPLFLLTVLEELRVFGSFDQLDARIKCCLAANNPADLFGIVLARMEADYGTQVVQAVMSAIWAARKGLSETELLGITEFTRLDISTFLLALDYHLARKGGLLNFFHDYLRQAVKARYLSSEIKVTAQHRKLAEWFERLPLDTRVATELPWQWQQSREKRNLKDCIAEIPMFLNLYTKDKNELLSYWIYLSDEFDVGTAYLESEKKWEIDSSPTEADIADTISELGLFLMNQCADYSTAELMLRRAFELRNKLFGKDHPDTAICMDNYAQLLQEKGEYANARKLFNDSLEIRRKYFGNDHPLTAACQIRLVALMNASGDFDEIENPARLALAALEKSTGFESYETLDAANNLAMLLKVKGRLEESRSIAERVVETASRVFGASHPITSTWQNNLAAVLLDMGLLTDSERLHKTALHQREKSLGLMHPSVAISLNNLAGVYLEQGNWDECENIASRALSIWEKVVGHVHRDTATSLHNMGTLFAREGKIDAAIASYTDAVEVWEATVGPNHSDIAYALSNLGLVKELQGDYPEAEKFHMKALQLREKGLGINHLESWMSRLLLAQLRMSRKQPMDLDESSIKTNGAEQKIIDDAILAGVDRYRARQFLWRDAAW